MIKTFSQIVILLTLFQFCKAQTNGYVSRKLNYIDSIQNAKQIADLISNIDKKYNAFKINDKLKFSDRKCQDISDSLKIQPWTKADFDNNGLTDILVIGDWYDHFIICILDKYSKYEIKRITRRSFEDCTFPVVENNNIKYYFKSDPERGEWDDPGKLKQITLTYKFGDFIEANQTPAKHEIEKIEYTTTLCFGSCPVFSITINSDRTAKWKAEMYNIINDKEVKGSFKSKITADKYNEIVNLLNYIDFESLQDNYAVTWTDDQTSTLSITYDDGKVKTIHDYGLIGTYGLDRVYEMLFELRENQTWIK